MAADRLEQAHEPGLGLARGARDEHDDADRRAVGAQRQRDRRADAVGERRPRGARGRRLARCRPATAARATSRPGPGSRRRPRSRASSPAAMKRSSRTPGAVQWRDAAQALVAGHPPQLGAVPAELAAERPRSGPAPTSSSPWRLDSSAHHGAARRRRAGCARRSSVTSRMTPTKPVGSPSQPLIARTWTSAQRSAPAVVRKRCSMAQRRRARRPAAARRRARARRGRRGARTPTHGRPSAVLDGVARWRAVQFSLRGASSARARRSRRRSRPCSRRRGGGAPRCGAGGPRRRGTRSGRR